MNCKGVLVTGGVGFIGQTDVPSYTARVRLPE